MLVELHVKKELNTLCFDFVLNLRNLSIIKTDQFIRFSTVKKLGLAKSELISVIHFCSDSTRFQLTWSHGEWNLKIQKVLPEKCICETMFETNDDFDKILPDLKRYIKESQKKTIAPIATNSGQVSESKPNWKFLILL